MPAVITQREDEVPAQEGAFTLPGSRMFHIRRPSKDTPKYWATPVQAVPVGNRTARTAATWKQRSQETRVRECFMSNPGSPQGHG